MMPTKNFSRIASSLVLLSILLGIALTYATTENNYTTDNNFLTDISESTHTESGYKASIIVNPDVVGIYAEENGYKLDLAINHVGIGGSLKEDNYKLDLIPEKTFREAALNAPPSASNLAITPTYPRTTDNLYASYTYIDPDGDPESGTEIRWYKDGALQSAYNDLKTVPSSATAKGDQWYFTVKPGDGILFGNLQTSPTVTIQNSPPSIDGVNITPDPAYANTNLTATPYGWYDADGDPEGYVYQWQKWDGTGWQDILGANSNTLSHVYFVRGDQIKVICTPYDGVAYGTPKEDTITISNSPPTIDSSYPHTNPTIREGESQGFNITKSDLDGDPLTVTWWLNQTDTGETSDFYAYVADYESAGTYNVTVVVSDGFSQASHQWTLMVTNVVRDSAVISLIPFKTVVGEGYSISINVTITNQGELTETFNAIVYANATSIASQAVTLTSGDSTTVTFAWNTTGFAKGNYTIKAVADTLPGETDTADNNMTDGWVIVAMIGDITGQRLSVPDGVVDVFDLVYLGSSYGAVYGEPKYKPNADINCNGAIDIFDLVAIARRYGQTDP